MVRGDPTPSVPVLGYRVAAIELEAAAARVLAMARSVRASTALVVTLNPEIVVRAERDPELAAALRQAELTVADGVGLVWAARRLGTPVPGRVPGIDLAERVLRLGGQGVGAFFLGGRPGVAEAAARAAEERFGARIVGSHHGYFEPADEGRVVDAIRDSGAELLLCALGERQELFVRAHGERLGVAAAIGVGGTLDVWAGAAQRTPAWTRRARIEWLWRVGLDPKRWHRIPRLIRFVALVLRRAWSAPRTGSGA